MKYLKKVTELEHVPTGIDFTYVLDPKTQSGKYAIRIHSDYVPQRGHADPKPWIFTDFEHDPVKFKQFFDTCVKAPPAKFESVEQTQ